MAFSKLSNHIDNLSDNIQAYVTSMLEYYKLDLFKKSTQGFAKLIKLLVYGSIFLFFLGFISVGFAFLIGKSIGSYTAGFFIIGGVYLLAFFCFFFFGDKKVDNFILHKFSSIFFTEEDSLEDELEQLEQKKRNEESFND